MTASALKGLKISNSFGKTFGFISGNSRMELYDDTVMLLTTSTIIDRTGKEYENTPIVPDVQTTDPIEKAKSWIEQQ